MIYISVHYNVFMHENLCRRVERRQLVALMEDGNELPCAMPELEKISKIVTYYNRWQVRAVPGAHTLTSPACPACLSA